MQQKIAGPAGNRRTNFAIAEVEPGLRHSGLIAFKRRADAFNRSFAGPYGLRSHFSGSANLLFLHPRGAAFFRKKASPRGCRKSRFALPLKWLRNPYGPAKLRLKASARRLKAIRPLWRRPGSTSAIAKFVRRFPAG